MGGLKEIEGNDIVLSRDKQAMINPTAASTTHQGEPSQ
ncbi:hypothetical protein V6N12_019918, partial [Hibiscus sabdariffa]